MKKIIFTLFALAYSAAFCMAQSKAEADSAYIKNDYKTAIKLYNALLQQGESATIYYNLGNCYYKTDSIAKAILNYERTLLLNPGDDDARANLDIAYAKTIDKIDAVPDIFYVGWIKSFIHLISLNAWARWAICAFLLMLVGLYFYIFSKQEKLKKAGFIVGIACLVLTICFNLFGQYQKDALTDRGEAIIMLPNVTVRSTPNDTGTALFVLHEGTKVSIKDNSMKSWKEIVLSDGKIGWISAKDIEII
jgi:tetratricopeptide (TPR) repeat protein